MPIMTRKLHLSEPVTTMVGAPYPGLAIFRELGLVGGVLVAPIGKVLVLLAFAFDRGRLLFSVGSFITDPTKDKCRAFCTMLRGFCALTNLKRLVLTRTTVPINSFRTSLTSGKFTWSIQSLEIRLFGSCHIEGRSMKLVTGE
jgi:hypothetical protein